LPSILLGAKVCGGSLWAVALRHFFIISKGGGVSLGSWTTKFNPGSCNTFSCCSSSDGILLEFGDIRSQVVSDSESIKERCTTVEIHLKSVLEEHDPPDPLFGPLSVFLTSKIEV
jgi:hypothetical protein